MVGTNVHTKKSEERPADDAAPLSALIFKILTDPYVGRLAFVRVYSGVLRSGSMLMNTTKGKRERIGRIVRMFADRREDVQTVHAGDIAAILGLKGSFTGDTLAEPSAPLLLENISFPKPVIEIAIEPNSKADEDKMGVALQRLAEEDPTFLVESDSAMGQTILRGMGELHLEVLVDRLLREFGVAGQRGPAARRLPRDDHAQQPCGYHFQAADGRRWSVRACHHRIRATERSRPRRIARWRGFPLRGCDARWFCAARIYPPGRQGHPRGPTGRHPRGFQCGGREGDAGGWRIPRGR